MLKKARRLSSVDLKEVLTRGRSKRATFLSMKYLTLPEPLRTSVVVPKSTARKATERNRLRRAAYHALVGATGQGKVVVFVQKSPQRALQAAFAKDLTQLLPTIQ
jgi:ribonuclease P protein component